MKSIEMTVVSTKDGELRLRAEEALVTEIKVVEEKQVTSVVGDLPPRGEAFFKNIGDLSSFTEGATVLVHIE